MLGLAELLGRSLAVASTKLKQLVACLAVFLALSTPLPSSAVTICLPVPTPNGIGRVCADIGEPSSKASKHVVVPGHINAQRTPMKSEGNILSRAGIRPMSLLDDAHAKIKAASLHRLDLIQNLEARKAAAEATTSTAQEQQLKGPERRKELLDKGIDLIGLKYGDTNMPRSIIIANEIDPVVVTGYLPSPTPHDGPNCAHRCAFTRRGAASCASI